MLFHHIFEGLECFGNLVVISHPFLIKILHLGGVYCLESDYLLFYHLPSYYCPPLPIQICSLSPDYGHGIHLFNHQECQK